MTAAKASSRGSAPAAAAPPTSERDSFSWAVWLFGFNFRRWWVQNWHRHVLPLSRIALLLPVLFSFVTALVLATNGQMREIVQLIVETEENAQYVNGLVVFCLIGWMSFSYYMSQTSTRHPAVFGSLSRYQVPAWIRALRPVIATACAILPLAGLGWALYGLHAQRRAVDLLVYTMIAIMALAVLLWGGRHLARHWARLRKFSRQQIFYWAGAVIFLIPMFLPVDYIVKWSRTIGPLAMTGLQLLAAFLAVVTVQRIWLRARGWALPALVLWTLATIGLGLCHWLLLPQRAGSSHKQADVARAVGPAAVAASFDSWIKSGPERASGPAFIVAAEGGGIFAASAVATFLAAMRDSQPAFADRVFAITGVSGGAVGAALYSGVTATDRKHEARARKVLTADHLSPVLAVMVPDLVWTLARDLAMLAGTPVRLLGDLLPLSWLKTPRQWWSDLYARLPEINRRDDLLEQSLNHGLGPGAHSKTIADHWNEGRGYALILNTTDAGNGDTVAFAPFSLEGLGDHKITSFVDAPYAILDDPSTVTEAAVASARFPLVLPPLIRTSGDQKRTFVDGGYADNSGAVVAGALFGHLRKHAAGNHSNVDLRLIVLTSETTNRRPHAPGSDVFVDFRVPFEALLNVRAGIGAREVTRIAERFADPAKALHQRSVLQIDYGDDFFLGWTISGTTLDSIATQVMPPETLRLSHEMATSTASPAHTSQDQLETRAERNRSAIETILCIVRGTRKAGSSDSSEPAPLTCPSR